MRTFWALLRLVAPARGWLALSALLAFATVGSGIGLMATAAFIIASAALHPSVADLAVAIVGVRFFGISRGVFRYLERYVTHSVTFRLLSRLRVWFYQSVEPLAPARLLQHRSGDLLGRVVADIETLQHFYIRVIAPTAAAVLVVAAIWLFMAAYDLSLGYTLVAFLLTAGVAVPLLTQRLSADAGRRLALVRGELNAQLVDGIQGLADLAAYGRDVEQLERVRALNERLTVAQERMALATGVHSALGSLLANLGMWAVLVVAIPLVAAGRIEGVYLPVLALAALASFEAVAPLPLAFQYLDNCLQSARRLFEIVGEGSLSEGERSEPNPPAPFSPSASPWGPEPPGEERTLDSPPLQGEGMGERSGRHLELSPLPLQAACRGDRRKPYVPTDSRQTDVDDGGKAYKGAFGVARGLPSAPGLRTRGVPCGPVVLRDERGASGGVMGYAAGDLRPPRYDQGGSPPPMGEGTGEGSGFPLPRGEGSGERFDSRPEPSPPSPGADGLSFRNETDGADIPSNPASDFGLVVRNLRFRYGPAEPLALDGVTFALPPGGHLAIVGPSGAGKSTLVNLLLRFWDYREGSIVLGGRELREYDDEEVRRLMGVVSQLTHLFNGTIRDNLLLARPKASPEEVERAARRAQLHDFVQTLPHRYDTWVGEQGLLLSGGERQRLAIARALLKDAPILILDEATANLDSLTEGEVVRAVRGLKEGRTTLTITHRLVGVTDADEILVLRAGKVVERGRHEDLVAAGGLYRRLWDLQNEALPLAVG